MTSLGTPFFFYLELGNRKLSRSNGSQPRNARYMNVCCILDTNTCLIQTYVHTFIHAGYACMQMCICIIIHLLINIAQEECYIICDILESLHF